MPPETRTAAYLVDPATLATLSHVEYGDSLPGDPITAHPKAAPEPRQLTRFERPSGLEPSICTRRTDTCGMPPDSKRRSRRISLHRGTPPGPVLLVPQPMHPSYDMHPSYGMHPSSAFLDVISELRTRSQLAQFVANR
ncbi:hypothetical protein TSOC_009449 [Tetrabaena socialis]|uniref:Uncharacterized protein n=1 Tax=Tetrabaena socialis TaxID=47790 RepID=A0A2J7ZVW0_9CHLO|nr:hypothetical protein TSOC_009449 [Tetrabaena socialis]|eukprot:PNH04395.1 hypothetical protein TSOC_009449 [Tetrabaena socialis]